MMELVCKVCFALCFIALSTSIWTVWQRPDLWMDLNVEFKEFDSRWDFNNQPMDMHIRNNDDKKAIKAQNVEQLASKKRLFDIKYIKGLNSDPLPEQSFFGTINPVGICEGKDASRCSPPFMRLESRIRTAPKYNLAACIIHKSMSTVLQAILCFLYDEKSFHDAGRVFSRELAKNRFCYNKNEFKEVYNARKAISMARRNKSIDIVTEAKPLLLAIIRNPIDRFLSGFIDKCIRKPSKTGYCNNCKANMTCFVMTEYDRLMKQVKSKKLARTFEDMHFFPQAWRCNFEKQLEKYHLLYYTSHSTLLKDFVGQLNTVFEQQGVPHASLEYISDQLHNGRTIHSTVSSGARQFLEQRLKSSSFLTEFVVRMLYADFKAFDYEVPSLNFHKSSISQLNV
ncbi:hypothetical protein M3Y97_00411500 [Aphelenchoides bicaudatus]|nr:hypothetical protein M3Y97_00411500 [Aphelenchoides bicaudatus]